MIDNAPQPDWRRLAPHRPLGPGADAYVTRPSSGGAEIAQWILGGGNTVLVGGPVGVGKSTECANAAFRLKPARIACLVQVDRLANIRRLTADEMLQLIGGRLFGLAVENLGFPDNHPLASNFSFAATPKGKNVFRASSPQVTRMLLSEVAKWSKQGRIVLVIDGLEKLAEGPSSLEIFDALGSLPMDVDLVAVVPWHVVYGRGSDVAVRTGERLFTVRPLDTAGPPGEIAAHFFGAVLAHRVLDPPAHLPPEFQALLGRAFKLSGGIPRTFLQIISDAATYAHIKRGEPWPNASDLDDALSEQRDSLRRLLTPGDTAAITSAVGTDGRELALDRKVRLLAHGILLERMGEHGPQLEAHPLVPLAV